jgi:hypothetical protein
MSTKNFFPKKSYCELKCFASDGGLIMGIIRFPKLKPRIPQSNKRDFPLRKLAASAARNIQKANAYDTWAARSFQANGKNELYASNRIGKAQLNVGFTPKFSISRNEKIFTMGSCFARRIEDALVEYGFDVPTHCDQLFDHPLLNWPDREKTAALQLRPRSYLNRYNSMSLLQEFHHLFGLAPEIADGQLIYPINTGAAADLHYSQALPQVTKDETLKRRLLVRKFLGRQIRRCSVFIITLGMAEAWYDKETQRYLNNTPGPRIMAAYNDRFEIHLSAFGQNIEALEKLHETLSSELSHSFNLIITVSPVPLEKTFFEEDAISINTYAKSTLRCVAQEFANNHKNVDYFPSYEIVSYTKMEEAWAWDRRHVKPSLVNHIIDTFSRHYLSKN